MLSAYSIVYASVITLAFVAATAYAIGRAHDARGRVEAFRLGWRRAIEWAEERDLRRQVAATRRESGEGPRAAARSHPRTAMPINQRRPLPRPGKGVPIEEAPTMDLAGRR
jgi:hypothetical protein